LLLAGVKKPGIVVHSLRHSTPTFALLNEANPTHVQELLEGVEKAVKQIIAVSFLAISESFLIHPPPLIKKFSLSSFGELRLPP